VTDRLRATARRIVVCLLLISLGALTISLHIVPVKTVDSIWNVSFGGTYNEIAYSVQQTSDGGYIAAGFTETFGAGSADAWLVKTNASGGMQWNRTFGGFYADEARCIRQTSDGGYIYAGFTRSFGHGDADFWLVKTEVNGAVGWSQAYGGMNDDCAFSVQQTSDMGYVMAGFTESFDVGGRDFWLVKTDSNGILQWNNTYGGMGLEQAFSVVQSVDGGYVIAGERHSEGSGDIDFWLVKTDPAGIAVWSNSYGGSGLDNARSVHQTSDGGYIIAGWTNSFGAGGTDCWVVKTDASGNHQWNRTYGGTFDEEAHSVQQTGDSGYIVAGSTKSFGLYIGVWNFWLVKTDAQGNKEWDLVNGGSSDDKAYSARQTSDGGYIMAGSTESYANGLTDFWLAKTAPHPPRPPEEGHDIAVISVSPSKAVVGEGISTSVNVTVENQGIYDEIPMVSLYVNTTSVEAIAIPLASGESATITFSWNTSGFAKGDYSVSATADQILEDTDITDNTFVDGKVKITFVGDVQGDGKVDATDLSDLMKAYASCPQSPVWNPNCDFNDDKRVDALDLSDLGKHYGQTL